MNLKVFSCLVTLLVVFGATPAESIEMSRPANGPLKVYVTIFIIDVDDISGANQSFDANVHIQCRWRDQRLAHKGPKSIVRALDEIWNPKIQIINQQKVWHTMTALLFQAQISYVPKPPF